VVCGGYRKDYKWRPFEETNVKVHIDRQKRGMVDYQVAFVAFQIATASIICLLTCEQDSRLPRRRHQAIHRMLDLQNWAARVILSIRLGVMVFRRSEIAC